MAADERITALRQLLDELSASTAPYPPQVEARLRELLASLEAAPGGEASARINRQVRDLLKRETPQLFARLDEISEKLEQGKSVRYASTPGGPLPITARRMRCKRDHSHTFWARSANACCPECGGEAEFYENSPAKKGAA